MVTPILVMRAGVARVVFLADCTRPHRYRCPAYSVLDPSKVVPTGMIRASRVRRGVRSIGLDDGNNFVHILASSTAAEVFVDRGCA